MKELDDFTVERLQAIAEPNALVFPPSHVEAAALARIALAAKTAEPEAFRVGGRLFSSMYAAGCYSSEMKLKIEPLYLDAQPNSPELPDGWKLVPVEPTRQMMSQGHFAMGGTDRGKFRRIYQAMINASPTTEK